MEEKLITFKMDPRIEKNLKILMDSGRYVTLGDAIASSIGNMAFIEEFKKNGDTVEVLKTDKSSKKTMRLQMK